MRATAVLLLAFTLPLPAQGCSRSHEYSDGIGPVADGGGSAIDDEPNKGDARAVRGGAGTGNDGHMGHMGTDTAGDASDRAAVEGDMRDGGAGDWAARYAAGTGDEGDRADVEDDVEDHHPIDGGVADECAEFHAHVTLQGNVVYDGYESGLIRITVKEDSSDRCTADPRAFVSRDPGYRIGQLELDGPGPFRITVEITWVNWGDAPNLVIVAKHELSDEEICAGGGLVRLSGVDQDDVEIVMERGFCPGLD